MLGFIKNKIFGGQQESKSLAKSRLHFVLVQDRTGLSNDDMANFKSEIISVIEKYFVIDKHAFDIAYQREQDMTTLVINSPVVVKREEALNGQVGARKKKGKRKANGQAAVGQ